MNAPDCLLPGVAGDRVSGRTLVRIGLERPLALDYLPLIAARDWGLADAHGISLLFGQPKRYSGSFLALERGDCDLILTNPLHLLEPMAHRYEALGCLLRTRGGVLAREDRLGKLRTGDSFRVASPASRPLTDRLCRRILQRWAGAQGFAVAETQIVVESADCNHVNNLRGGFDAAWLAFANTDEMAARERGIAVRLLTEEQAGLPGFSALEIVARKPRRPDETGWHEALVALLERAVRQLRSDPQAAVRLWREATGNDAEAGVLATLPCLQAPLIRTPGRWNSLEELLQEA